MRKPTRGTKAIKAGTSKAATAQRKRLFIEMYIANEGNGTQAAIAAGYSPKGADVRASELLGDRRILAEIQRRKDEALKIAGLTAERTLRENARLSFSDPRKLFKEDGTLRTVSELDEDTAAAVARFEVNETNVNGKRIVTTKVWFWDKNAALEKAMKHLGLYERDNKQKGDAAVAALLAHVQAQDAGFAIKH